MSKKIATLYLDDVGLRVAIVQGNRVKSVPRRLWIRT